MCCLKCVRGKIRENWKGWIGGARGREEKCIIYSLKAWKKETALTFKNIPECNIKLIVRKDGASAHQTQWLGIGNSQWVFTNMGINFCFRRYQVISWQFYCLLQSWAAKLASEVALLEPTYQLPCLNASGQIYVSNTARGLSELRQRETHANRKPPCFNFWSIGFEKRFLRNVIVWIGLTCRLLIKI